MIKYIIKTFRLVILTLIVGWYFGMFFYVYSDLTDLFDNGTSGTEYFIEKFNIDSKTASESSLIIMYWAFTTLMTIGLGDYYPASNYERVLGAFLMLAGVALFSIIKDNFTQVYTFFTELNSDLED